MCACVREFKAKCGRVECLGAQFNASTMSQFPTPQEAKEQRNDENSDEDIKQNLGYIDCSPRHSAKTENGPNDGDEKKYQGIPEHKE